MFHRKFDGFQSKSQKHIFSSLFIHHSFEVYLLKVAQIRYSVLHDGNCNILEMGALGVTVRPVLLLLYYMMKNILVCCLRKQI